MRDAGRRNGFDWHGSGRLGFAGNADAQVAQVGDEPVVLVGLEDHEIRGLASPLEEAGASGGVVGRSQELDEGAIAGGENGVVQAELGQRTGAAGLHAEDATIEVDALGQVVDHHRDLAELGEHGIGCPLAEGTAAAVAAAGRDSLLQLGFQGLHLGLGFLTPASLFLPRSFGFLVLLLHFLDPAGVEIC